MRRGLWLIVNSIPTRLIGGQNKFSSPPTPYETHGMNVTICPANICNKQRNSNKVNNYESIITGRLQMNRQKEKYRY
jgi:hypothetical protein